MEEDLAVENIQFRKSNLDKIEYERYDLPDFVEYRKRLIVVACLLPELVILSKFRKINRLFVKQLINFLS